MVARSYEPIEPMTLQAKARDALRRHGRQVRRLQIKKTIRMASHIRKAIQRAWTPMAVMAKTMTNIDLEGSLPVTYSALPPGWTFIRCNPHGRAPQFQTRSRHGIIDRLTFRLR